METLVSFIFTVLYIRTLFYNNRERLCLIILGFTPFPFRESLVSHPKNNFLNFGKIKSFNKSIFWFLNLYISLTFTYPRFYKMVVPVGFSSQVTSSLQHILILKLSKFVSLKFHIMEFFVHAKHVTQS